MDLETGEYCQDTETGEFFHYHCDHDLETGENQNWPPHHTFKIPRSCYTKKSKKFIKPLKANKQELELITAAIYLLPTMVFNYPLIAIFVLLIEIVLHHFAHEKNKKLKSDAKVYFQSPLHGIVKEFCARCKEEQSVNKITRLQDIRNDKMRKNLDCLKRVVT